MAVDVPLDVVLLVIVVVVVVGEASLSSRGIQK